MIVEAKLLKIGTDVNGYPEGHTWQFRPRKARKGLALHNEPLVMPHYAANAFVAETLLDVVMRL